MNITSPLQASATDILAHASAPGASMAALSDKFASIMNRAPEAPASETGETSTLANVLINQDETMRRNVEGMHELAAAQTTGVSDRELSQRQMELTYQITTAQFQFNAGVYLAQSSKTGFQTLMRNQ